jgi:hypothetical protein
MENGPFDVKSTIGLISWTLSVNAGHILLEIQG